MPVPLLTAEPIQSAAATNQAAAEAGDAAAATAALLAHQAEHLERLLPALSRQVFDLPPPPNALADLPLAQFRLCILLSREGRRTMSQLGEELHISVSAVTQMADRLEKVDLVERVTEKTGDRRTRHLQLTAHGQSLILARRALRTDRAAQTLAMMPPPMRETVLHVLETLLSASRALPARDDAAAPQQRTDEHL